MNAREPSTPPHQNDRPAIRLRQVCVGYNGAWVLHNISLDIAEGVFLPFVGPNGGGKTTLLRAILGLLPSEGTIAFERPGMRLGYVPQQKTIDPLFPVTALEVVSMVFFSNWGWLRRPDRTQRARALAALDGVGLANAAHRSYRELSGGMKQKVLIARALASGADILVLDEPTSELDTPSENEILSDLLRLSREQGKTVLISCHGIHLALSLADRVCLVEHGHARIVDIAEARRFVVTTPDARACGCQDKEMS